MRVRTFLSLLVALAAVVTVAYFTQQNRDLLQESFQLWTGRSVPLYAVLLAVFLLGFLPAVTVLLVETLKQDLAHRRQRRFDREARSLRGSYRRAVDLQEDGQLSRAASELQAVLADQPEDFNTLLRFGEVLRHQGKVQEALEVHRRASVLYPHSTGILYQLVEDYEAQGSPEVAHQIRERILRDFPGLGLRILRRRRNAALVRQDWESANRLQEQIETLRRESGDTSEFDPERGLRRGLTYERGVALLENERLDEARRVFEEILDEDRLFVPARILLGESLLLAGDSAGAVAEWRQGWESTGSPTFLQRIEDFFIEGEEPLEAIGTLREIIAKADNDLLPRLFLGQLYARLEMHDEALKVLSKLRNRVDESPAFLYLLGQLYERCSQRAEASEAYRASLKLANLSTRSYSCRVCGTRCETWLARCESCGSWNSVELQFEVQATTVEDQSRRAGPVWPVYDPE